MEGDFLMRKIFSILLAVCMVVSCANYEKEATAARLYSSSKKIEKGSKLKISLFSYWGKGNVKWSTSNSKLKIVKKKQKKLYC